MSDIAEVLVFSSSYITYWNYLEISTRQLPRLSKQQKLDMSASGSGKRICIHGPYENLFLYYLPLYRAQPAPNV